MLRADARRCSLRKSCRYSPEYAGERRSRAGPCPNCRKELGRCDRRVEAPEHTAERRLEQPDGLHPPQGGKPRLRRRRELLRRSAAPGPQTQGRAGILGRVVPDQGRPGQGRATAGRAGQGVLPALRGIHRPEERGGALQIGGQQVRCQTLRVTACPAGNGVRRLRRDPGGLSGVSAGRSDDQR